MAVPQSREHKRHKLCDLGRSDRRRMITPKVGNVTIRIRLF
jgi:hypothetical protein